MTRREWEASVLEPACAKAPERAAPFRTSSGREVDVLSTPEDVTDIDYDRDIADPGTFPFTRGVHRQGYRSRLWTARQFAGFGTPAEANARYRHLLASGATGLSVAFDLPTLMGRDPDHPLSAGEVGRCGVSVASLADMLELFDAIDPGAVSVSMTINAPAPMIFALFLVAAERRGVPWAALSGTLQNDILKEFIAQKEFIYPPRPSMRLVTDVIAFCHAHVPRWYPVSVSGYHIREAGATAQQELSFTMADAVAYVGDAIEAGLDVDGFGPRISFFFNAQSDFFEEIAKFRAARQVWARIMRERFGARTDKACALRFHTQTSGVSLTAQQPYNNVARTTFQALAAVLGGTNSLHTNALDEALGLPTADAATLALRTQQVLAHECGLAGDVDPFGGSWWVERLTRDFVERTLADIEEIDRMGGMVSAVEQGIPQRRIAESAYRAQLDVEAGRRAIVGVNTNVDADPHGVLTLAIDEAVAARQVERVRSARRDRDARAVAAALERLRQVALGTGNTMEGLVACVRAGATLGEMCDVLRTHWGEYVESVGT
jgi:methylmalonyl-CoA mutase N-terminal domain/subunit